MNAVSTYINKSNNEQIVILKSLRLLIHESAEEVKEAIKWGFPVFSVNGKDFCYMRYSKNHVTLGFYFPEKITTNTHLLEGAGTVLKHIKIKSIDSINVSIIKDWLHQIIF